MPAGPELCACLAPVELGAVPDEHLFELLGAQSRQLAYQQSQLWAVMAEIAHRDPTPNLPSAARWTADEIFDSAVDEVRAELRLTRRAARRELEHACGVAALPRVAQALAEGQIDRTRATVLADGCLDLSEPQAAALLDNVMPGAGTVTATRLAEKVRTIAVALDPGWAERRYRQAVRERKVIGYLNPDGSATVSGQYLPAEQAAAACARVDTLADAAKRAGAQAPIDHLRAELFLGLLDGRFHGMSESAIVAELQRQFPGSESPAEETPEQMHAQSPAAAGDQPIELTAATTRGVHLRVSLGTLLGLDEHPGEVAGWGPVPASVARRIVARQQKAEWRFAVLDGDGQLLFDGITRRRPPRNQTDNQEAQGGIVELHVPRTVLTDCCQSDEHPGWTALLADLAAQYAHQRPIDQDPAARFPGRPLRRRTQIAFQRCIFPGCRRPASECDLDHRRDHSRGGQTEEENLEPGCRHDHQLKTSRGWRLVRRDERTFVWISPLGRRHLVRMEPVAPPLPAPIPRRLPPDLAIPDDELRDLEPSFEARSRRGRPLASKAGAHPATTPTGGAESDPPPF